jgi:NADH dehydrogenase FAD-containing subunit
MHRCDSAREGSAMALPLFYQLATCEFTPRDVGFSLRKILHKSPNVDIKLAEINVIDPKAHRGGVIRPRPRI